MDPRFHGEDEGAWRGSAGGAGTREGGAHHLALQLVALSKAKGFMYPKEPPDQATKEISFTGQGIGASPVPARTKRAKAAA